ncbi:MAG: hypothetical protein IT456_13030 [Planctomycetes bacterium]|nr:hypothetical protein [Planctomycetota bacterium]
MRTPWLAVLCCCLSLPAQGGLAKKSADADDKARAAPLRFTEFPVPEPAPLEVDVATKAAIAALLALQEGPDSDQWPYEGVYREDEGQLPVGYRVGGTAIACLGLVAAPGFRDDAARVAAVGRGLTFVLKTLEAPRMQIAFEGTYDVRGWGHIYALEMLLQLQDAQAVPEDLHDAVQGKVEWLIQALVESAIPKAGGWNYSRPRGYLSAANTASTFMTAPALQALFHAKARRHAVPDEVITQALDALDRARAKPGGYAYGAPAKSQNEVEEEDLPFMNLTPSSAARATVCETTLLLAGRGDVGRLQTAIERFFTNWDALAVRKSKQGTHIKPYGIAPYYFLFGHLYAAQAIEQLPDVAKRDELRARLRQVLARSREADGSWNDRQFGRSGGYGTAFAIMTLHMPHLPKPCEWRPSAAPSADTKAGAPK